MRRTIMQPKIKTIPVENQETQRGDSRFWVKVQRAKVSDNEQVMHANRNIPFYRGYAAIRGVQYSPLND